MPTLEVPDDFPTINAAILAAQSNDIISVAAGVYNEIVTIPSNKSSLTLIGAKAGIDARDRNPDDETDTIIQFPTVMPSITTGLGVVNIYANSITIDGFTIRSQENILGPKIPNTAAISTVDLGIFPPSAQSTNVYGLTIINNIIVNNSNGILVASVTPQIESTYTIRLNYFKDNNGLVSNGDGNGIFVGNTLAYTEPYYMYSAVIHENLFAGNEPNAAIRADNVYNSTIMYNTINTDGAITAYRSNNIEIRNNVISNSISNAIYIDNNTSIQIIDNIMQNSLSSISSGIYIINNNNQISVSGNCISGYGTGITISVANTDINIIDCNINNNNTGIIVYYTDPITMQSGANSAINITLNIIELNTGAGFVVQANSYVQNPFQLNAVSNWWDSSTGPNYQGLGPGTGQLIIDPSGYVLYAPYVDIRPSISCKNMVNFNKIGTQDVLPGSSVEFSILISSSELLSNIISITDNLPQFPDSSTPLEWSIVIQNPPNTFVLTGPVGLQVLSLAVSPTKINPPTTILVILSANTTINDAGKVIVNTASLVTQYVGTPITQTQISSATSSVMVCVHRSSLIMMSDNTEKTIESLKPGECILGADGNHVNIIESVPCLISDQHNNCGTCIVFEPNSISPGIPTKRFGVDAGHPIGVLTEYTDNSTLKPAKEFINDTTIYAKRWDAVGDLFEGENKRYDIIMPETSCKAYIANGMVVKSRASRIVPGYDYF